jgi:hypothetical protein
MLRRESIGLKFYSLWDYSLSKLNPDLTKSLELFVEISVVTWRSLIHYVRHVLVYDLIYFDFIIFIQNIIDIILYMNYLYINNNKR